MTTKRTDTASRYDLPCSRILIRSLRYCERRAESLASAGGSGFSKQEIKDRLLMMVRDLFLVRLLEDRRVIDDYYLCGGKKSKRFDPADAAARVREFNSWAGWELFDLEAWESPGPGEEFAELYHELQLSRFWPAGMPVEVLGALWEERLSVPRRSGLYYTPKRIVNVVLSSALDRLLKERKPLPVRVLDPACGSGYFLIQAFRKLMNRELSKYRSGGDLFAPVIKGKSGQMALDPARRMELMAEHLFGVDIDGVALDLARRAMYVEAISDTPALSGTAPSQKPLFTNLREGDSILEQSFPQQVDLFDPARTPPIKPFDWKDEDAGFGREIIEDGFTCIIGNPPWISLKGRYRQAPYSNDIVKHLIRRYDADTYRPNVVEFFIKRAIELLSENGWHSFVVPDRIAENEQYNSLRQYMLERGELVSLHYREPFPGVVADTLIYTFCKRKRPRRSLKIEVTDAAGRDRKVTQSYWVKGEGYGPLGTQRDDVEGILKKIEASGRRKLSDFMESGVGFIARPNKIAGERVHDDQQPVIKGEHVMPYKREGNAWLEFTISNLAGGTRNLEKLSKKERILIRKTGARLIAAADTSRYLPEQSLYFAFRRDRRLSRPYHINYFLGILNSRIMSFYFRRRKITNRATTPQIKKIHLDTLPIRPVHFNDPKARRLHDDLVEAVKRREDGKTPESIAELDNMIDNCVAALYALDEKDMETIKEEMKKGW
jgi:SAM-dependent methyltransferase